MNIHLELKDYLNENENILEAEFEPEYEEQCELLEMPFSLVRNTVEESIIQDLKKYEMKQNENIMRDSLKSRVKNPGNMSMGPGENDDSLNEGLSLEKKPELMQHRRGEPSVDFTHEKGISMNELQAKLDSVKHPKHDDLSGICDLGDDFFSSNWDDNEEFDGSMKDLSLSLEMPDIDKEFDDLNDLESSI